MCRVFPGRAHRSVPSSIVHAGQCERNAREGQRSPADRNIGEGQGHKSRHRRTGVVATLAANGSYCGYRTLRRRVLARFVPGRRLARCILHSKHEHLGHATWSLYLRHAHDPMAVGQQVAAPWCPRGDHGARAKTCPRPLCVVETRHDLRPGGPIRFQREVILIDGNGSKDNVDVGRR